MPVREGAVLLNQAGDAIGRLTSGGYGPSVMAPVAMAYVQSEYAAPGTELHVNIRNRNHTVYTAALPFVKHRYHEK